MSKDIFKTETEKLILGKEMMTMAFYDFYDVCGVFPWVAQHEDDHELVKIDDAGDEYWSLENDYSEPYDNSNAWNYVHINPEMIASVTDDEYVAFGKAYPYCEIKMATGDSYYLPCLWKDAGISRKRK